MRKAVKQQKVHKNSLKLVLLISCLLFLITLLIYGFFIRAPLNYNIGQNAFDNGDYNKATISFMRAYGYKDSFDKIQEIKSSLHVLSATESVTLAVNADGSVVIADGGVNAEYDVTHWENIVSVCAGDDYIIGLKADGKPVTSVRTPARAFTDSGQMNVLDWQDIVQICTSGEHTVGLKADGTVVAVGNNDFGQCDTGDWRNIVAVSTGGFFTVGLLSDGTVTVAGGFEGEDFKTIDRWKNIVAVSGGLNHIVGLKANGRVVATGDNTYNQCGGVKLWNRIIGVEAGTARTFGIKSNGDVAVCGRDPVHRDPAIKTQGPKDGRSLQDVVALSAKMSQTVGLRSDGSVVVFWPGYASEIIESWDGIVPSG